MIQIVHIDISKQAQLKCFQWFRYHAWVHYHWRRLCRKKQLKHITTRRFRLQLVLQLEFPIWNCNWNAEETGVLISVSYIYRSC